jgi:hypothetical protein
MYLQVAAAAALVVIIGMGIWSYEGKIDTLLATEKELRADLEVANGSLVVQEANVVTLRASIKDMNLATEKLAIEYTLLLKEYELEKSKPATIRYQKVYKFLPEGVGNECEDIKSSVNGLVSYINDRMQ